VNVLKAWGVALALALGPVGLAADGKGVTIDAKDAPVADVMKLLAAQGAPTIAVHPDLATQKITFAAKAIPGSAALRWLCRTCNLVVFAGRDDRLLIARPEAEPVVEKEYNVAKLVTTQEQDDALVNFIKKVLFGIHPIRGKGEDGATLPAFEAVIERGKLKVAATAIVHREVLALLRAMGKVQPKRSMEDLFVSYAPYEVGFLGIRSLGAAPKSVGEVTVDVSGVSPAEAAWALTSAAKVSFYVDPWDKALNEIKVTLKAEKRTLADVANELGDQLRAERCWYDEAWLFVRSERRPLFESFEARVYNIEGAGPVRRMLAQAGRDAARGPWAASSGLPFAIEHADDLLLIAGPAAWHEAAQNFVKNGPDWDRERRPNGPRGKGGRMGR